MRVESFEININDEELNSLIQRVRSTRLPDNGPRQLEKSLWHMGTPLSFAIKLRDYWLSEYDWRKNEKAINGLGKHYKAYMDEHFDNLGIHFILAKPEVPTLRLPVLLIHGWPGGFWEFHKVIPLLTAAGITCVVPSLPGYGFSDPPQKEGYTTVRFAEMFDSLMKGMGYKEYYAQGGDWGSEICKVMGSNDGFGCKALHLNMHVCEPPDVQDDNNDAEFSEEDISKLARMKNMIDEGMGYMRIQGTRPQSLGYALNDSPMGLACYIIEKFHAWTDTHGSDDPTVTVSMDEMLTNVSIYWFSQCITSSMRLYFESIGLGKHAPVRYSRVTIPCCIAEFPKEVITVPRRWVSAAFNVHRFSVFKQGGHFAALECPDEFSADVISFFFDIQRSML